LQDGELGLGKSKTVKVLESFIRDFSDLQLIAISGKNPKMKKKFEDLVEFYKKQNVVKVLAYTNKVPELMSIADLVVTKPGRTYYNRKLSFSVFR